MKKNILKIDVAEMLRKYEGKKCSFDLVGTSAVIETNSDLHEIDLDYTKTATAMPIQIHGLRGSIKTSKTHFAHFAKNIAIIIMTGSDMET